MTFVNPHILFGLFLASLPVVIYYLMRFRSLRVNWGATYVLERALKRLKRRIHLEQVILIALRVLAVCAMVAAFARPVSRTKSAVMAGGKVHRILLVDGSYSMHAGPDGDTTWDKACTAMKGLVSAWGRGGRWSVYLVDDAPNWVLEDEIVETAEKSCRVIDSLRPAEASASMAEALRTVLARSGGGETEITIVADAQLTTWKDIGSVTLPPDGSVRLFWLHPPRHDTGNLAVTRVSVNHEKVLVDHPLSVFVKVRNFGEEPVENAEVKLLLDGAYASRDAISLLPGQEGWLHFVVTCGQPGSHAVTARLQKDVLQFDNRMSAGVEVVDEFKVTVLRDKDRPEKFTSSWRFLQLAASVMQRKDRDGVSLFSKGRLRISLCDGRLSRAGLAGTDVVVLDGGRSLTRDLAATLKEYVTGGGGLLLAAGTTVDRTRWNEFLGGAGLLPAKLLSFRNEALGGKRYQTLSRTGFEDPALRSFETGEDGDVLNARLYSWVELGEPAEGASVLARLSNNAPFAIGKRFELGSVILLAAGLNCRNNNLMAREFAYPLLIGLFSQAASGSVYPRTVGTGEPIRLRLPKGDSSLGIQFSIGGGKPSVVNPRGGTAVLPEGASRSGLGSMLIARRNQHERIWYGVQGRRVGSDLTPLTAKQKETMLAELGMVEASNWDALKALLAASYRGAEWCHWMIAGAIVFLISEMAMLRRFVVTIR